MLPWAIACSSKAENYRKNSHSGSRFHQPAPGAELTAAREAVEASINSLWAAVEADARARMA